MTAPLKIGPVELTDLSHRLFAGTGKYADYDVMARALDASGCHVPASTRVQS